MPTFICQEINYETQLLTVTKSWSANKNRGIFRLLPALMRNRLLTVHTRCVTESNGNVESSKMSFTTYTS